VGHIRLGSLELHLDKSEYILVPKIERWVGIWALLPLIRGESVLTLQLAVMACPEGPETAALPRVGPSVGHAEPGATCQGICAPPLCGRVQYVCETHSTWMMARRKGSTVPAAGAGHHPL
jgi:hypothetical protein